MTFPSIPGWDGIHPAMVQFAIVLLWMAPLLLLVSLFSRRAWGPWAGAALLTMALGTVAAWLAVASGHAAGQLVDKTPAVQLAIASHEALGLKTRNLFTLYTGVMAALLLLPALIRKPLPAAARIGMHAVFLVLYVGSTIVIADAASHGGRLVHGLGVRAVLAASEPQEVLAAGSPTARPGATGARPAPAPAPAPPRP